MTFSSGQDLRKNLLLQTENLPISSLMQKLLGGYATTFNLNHQRCGHLFQNRYKSILCQKETYLLELVRHRSGPVGRADQFRDTIHHFTFDMDERSLYIAVDLLNQIKAA